MSSPVLDVCCGSRAFWFNQDDKRAVFVDIRHESHRVKDVSKGTKYRTIHISPDIVADFASLPFRDETFDLVIFDPPHLLNAGESGWMVKKYGKLRGEWSSKLKLGFSECFRVLAPGGTLIFKWSEIDIPVSHILTLTPEKPLFGNRCGKQSKTHWIAFIKSTAIEE